MTSAVLSNIIQNIESLSDNSVWSGEPTTWGVIIYSYVIPIICSLGIFGNFVILLVLSGKTLKESTYTYLTVLAIADLFTCILLLFSGLARGSFWKVNGWIEFDVFIHIPLCTLSSNVSVLAAIFVAVDRLVIVIGPVKYCQPKFCRKIVARKLMSISIFISLLLNIPYFFIYTYDEDGNLVGNKISESCFYNILNWLQLIVFGLGAATFLLVSNGIMIFAVRRTLKQRQLLLKGKQSREGKYLCDQSKLTITLVSIVFLFLIGEVPTHLASRRSAASILYAGDSTKINKQTMEIFRIIATLLNSISCSANFILYCLLNPRFFKILKSMFTSEKSKKTQDTAMKITTIKILNSDNTSSSKVSDQESPCQF